MYIDVGHAGYFGPSPMSILFDSETGLHLWCVLHLVSMLQTQVLAFAAFGGVTAELFVLLVRRAWRRGAQHAGVRCFVRDLHGHRLSEPGA